MRASTCGRETTVTDTRAVDTSGSESSTGPGDTRSRARCCGAVEAAMTGAPMGAIPMSEAEYHRQQAQEALEAKREERRKARAYIQGEYQRHGLSEQERDEILAMLGITTDVDIDSPGYGAALGTTSRGLVKYAGKSVAPRTPPSRAS